MQHWSQEHTNRKEIARQLQPIYLMTRHVHSASGRATSVAATSPLRLTHTRADHTTHGLFASFSHYLSYLTVSLESLIIRLLEIRTFIHLYLLNQQNIVEVFFFFFFQNTFGFTLPVSPVLRKYFSHLKVYKSHVKSGIPVAVGIKKVPKD